MSTIEVKKKTGESVESLLRRFKKRLQRSRILLHVKEDRFFKKDLTKRSMRVSALARNKKRRQMEYLKKIGKLKEEEPKY